MFVLKQRLIEDKVSEMSEWLQSDLLFGKVKFFINKIFNK
jgi:hypothetical protein